MVGTLVKQRVNFSRPLDNSRLIVDREQWLVERCIGKTVLHIGCVDTGILEWRLGTKSLLHSRLEKSANKIVGIDIDVEGIKKLRSIGFTNIEILDISRDYSKIIEIGNELGGFDLILVPEVLEHVMNMGSFLNGIRKVAKEFTTELVFTVPNAYSIRGIAEILFKRELVHPDHNCYFSSTTIRTTLRKSKIETKEVMFYSNINTPQSLIKKILKNILNKTLLKWLPYYSEGIICIAYVKE